MEIKILARSAQPGQIFAIAPQSCLHDGFHALVDPCRPRLPVSTRLYSPTDGQAFIVTGHTWLDCQTACGNRAILCPLVQNIMPSCNGAMTLEIIPDHWTVAIITLSDKGSIGQRDDKSGSAILEMVNNAINVSFTRNFMLEDNENLLTALLGRLAFEDEYDVIITTGGTGVGPKDFTPQSTRRVIETALPGYAQAMMAASLEKTPNAVISRSTAGIAGHSLIINLPGSIKAVRENLSAVIDAIPHTLKKLHGDTEDCGD